MGRVSFVQGFEVELALKLTAGVTVEKLIADVGQWAGAEGCSVEDLDVGIDDNTEGTGKWVWLYGTFPMDAVLVYGTQHFEGGGRLYEQDIEDGWASAKEAKQDIEEFFTNLGYEIELFRAVRYNLDNSDDWYYVKKGEQI